ncbi:MAG: hypothetical protein MK194_03345 [Roseibacillus sp.]|nr:hypothetical protein [Roseibacillus sp.]
MSCTLALAMGLTSCSPRDPGRSPRSIIVSPYSTLSDRELNAYYLDLLSKLQKLNGEMNKANRARDFGTVNKMAADGLEKARAARRIARHIDNEELRKRRLAAIDIIIRDLSNLAEITREG